MADSMAAKDLLFLGRFSKMSHEQRVYMKEYMTMAVRSDCEDYKDLTPLKWSSRGRDFLDRFKMLSYQSRVYIKEYMLVHIANDQGDESPDVSSEEVSEGEAPDFWFKDQKFRCDPSGVYREVDPADDAEDGSPKRGPKSAYHKKPIQIGGWRCNPMGVWHKVGVPQHAEEDRQWYQDSEEQWHKAEPTESGYRDCWGKWHKATEPTLAEKKDTAEGSFGEPRFIERKVPICTFLLKGMCLRWRRCRFSHDITGMSQKQFRMFITGTANNLDAYPTGDEEEAPPEEDQAPPTDVRSNRA